MSLQQRGNPSQQKLSQQLKSVNLDISILSGLTKKTQKEFQTKSKPNKLSLNQLSLVLKNKSQKYIGFKEDKHETIEWLKYKGLDWRKLNHEISENARVAEEMAISRDRKASLKGMDVSVMMRREAMVRVPQAERQYGFTPQLQQEFITKQKEVTSCKTILKSLNSTKSKSNTRNALLNKIKGEKYNKQFSLDLNKQLLDSVGDESKHREDQQRVRLQYFDFVECLATRGFAESLQKLKGVRGFWKIVLQHVKTVQHYASEIEDLKKSKGRLSRQDQQIEQTHLQLRMKSFLMLKSLKIVQNQIDKSLPKTQQSFQKLDQLIRDAQRRSRKLRVWRNYNGQASWALTFMLLKAGRTSEIIRVLQNVDKQMLIQILNYQQSIDKQQPRPSLKKHEISRYNDNFYHQLVRILEASPKFDPQVILESNLTKVWLILRTMGIYRAEKEIEIMYERMIEQIIQRQFVEEGPITEQKVEEFLYLGAYRQFINLAEMILQNKEEKHFVEITHDDYFHLLTLVNYFPELWGDEPNKEKISLEVKYPLVLVEYMKKLRLEGYKQETPRYLLISPPSGIQRVAIQFLTTPKQYQEFDWKQLKDLIRIRDPTNGLQLSRKLQQQVLDSLKLKTFEDLVFASENYQKTSNQSENSLYKEHKCYVKILLAYNYFREKKRDISKRNENMKDFQRQMFDFFGIEQGIQDEKSLLQKDKEIKQWVTTCEDRLEKELVRDSNNESYVKQVILPFMFYKSFTRLSTLIQNPMQSIPQLKSFQSQWYKGLTDQKKWNFGILPKQDLLQFLKFQFEQEMVGFYVYYLLLLIERKKIVCSVDCEYMGVMKYVEFIAKELNAIQNYYRTKEQEIKKRQSRHPTQEEMRLSIQESTNPLTGCQEYHRLRQLIDSALNYPSKQLSPDNQPPKAYQSQRPFRREVDSRERFTMK